jgi:hypothetical protein
MEAEDPEASSDLQYLNAAIGDLDNAFESMENEVRSVGGLSPVDPVSELAQGGPEPEPGRTIEAEAEDRVA